MNSYLALEKAQAKEWNAFPLGFAFSDKQFKEMMEKWGLRPDETDKIYSIGAGGFVRKSDADAFHEMVERHERELKNAREENKDDYLFNMFDYELANHEFGYTGDVTDTLDALCLTMDEIMENKAMREASNRAVNKYI